MQADFVIYTDKILYGAVHVYTCTVPVSALCMHSRQSTCKSFTNCLFVRLFVRPSVCPSVCLSVRVSFLRVYPPPTLPPLPFTQSEDSAVMACREHEMAANLLSRLYHEVIQADQMQKGFRNLLASVDDLKLDVPAAEDDLALFLARAVVDDILPPAFLQKVPCGEPSNPCLTPNN